MDICRTMLGLIAAIFAIALSNPKEATAGTMYAVNFDSQGIGQAGKLYTINPSNAVATLVATLNSPFKITQPMGLAFTPSGQLFTYTSSNLYEISLTSGSIRRVDLKSSEPSTGEGDLAYDRITGLFYASGATYDSIITINPTTGERKTVGETGKFGRDVSGLAFASDGTLFGLALRDGAPDLLVKIDTLTGLATPIGETGTNAQSGLAGLIFDPKDGVLYMSVDSKLYTVNPKTGAAVLIDTMRLSGAKINSSIGFVSGMTILSDVPEPSTVTLSLCAAIGLAAGNLRRARGNARRLRHFSQDEWPDIHR